jgi:hypothetical protein
MANPAKVMENLLLRLFAYRTGVEQDDVRFFDIVSLDDAFFWWARTDLNRGPKDYESSALTN